MELCQKTRVYLNMEYLTAEGTNLQIALAEFYMIF